MRLVLDTNVVVSGLIWGGVPRRLLELGRDGSVQLFTSAPLLDELADVLGREKFAGLLVARGITRDFLMQRYGVLARVVRPQRLVGPVARDADDDVVIATALAAKVELVVSGDRDLLVLNPWHGIPILNASEALSRITHAYPVGP